jgi:signal transduction histidine kinase/ligand-binding sensor domain-containing protein
MGIRKPRRWAQGAGTRLEDNDDQPPNTRRKPRVRAFFAVLSLWLAVAQPALAQGDALSIAQFRHSAWKSNNTVPSSINHIIQSSDGYLWIASVDGLSRFDGVAFETFSPATDDPTASYSAAAVLQTRAGEIWVGRFFGGGVSILRDGHFVSAGMPNPSRSVLELAQDLDDAIWVANARPSKALSRFANGRWEELGPEWGMPDGWVFAMMVARDGSLWLSTMDNVAVLRRGARRFEVTNAIVKGGGDLAEDSHGHIWLSDQLGVRRLPDYPSGQTETRGLPNYPDPNLRRRTRIAFARDGSLWGASTGGLFRIATPDAHGVKTTFGVKDGLTDDGMVAVFSDREGTIWTGGERGLNAFVTPSVVEETAIPGGATEYSIAEDGRGSVYVSDGLSLYLIRPHQSPAVIRHGLSGDVSLCASDGAVWLVQGQKVERIKDGRTVQSLVMPHPVGASLCGESADGKLWISGNDHKLAVHDGAGWREDQRLADDLDRIIFSDRRGRPIIASGSSLTQIEGEKTTSWSPDQLQLGRLTFAHDGATGLIAIGSAGLARLGEGRIDRITTRRHPWLRYVRQMIETPDGEIWLFSYSGIIRLSVADLDRAFAHPDQPIRYRLFDELDGLVSGADRFEGVRTARGGDGRLWFLGRSSVMRVTPGELTTNTLPPPILIRSVLAGGRAMSPVDPVRLVAGMKALQIDYAALSLRVPSRVRFRYRLAGVDDAWVEAGTRRTAFYNNLPPGQYRFTVTGANDDGIWNTTGASLDITVPPTFWQSRWFLSLCLLAFMAATWLLYRARLGAVTARLRSHMNERIAERERIARELHDTLIQGVQGLILRFQLITEDLPRDQPQRAALENALDDADEVLGQARDRVLDLRVAERTEDFEAALSKLAQGQDRGGGPPVSVFFDGPPRALDEIASDEVLRIVGEALANARAHAQAGHIEIRVQFAARRLTVSVVDDGQGVAQDILRDGGRPGHFGLAGMRERARAVHGRLVLDSQAGAGTRVILTIPARAAYAPRPWSSWRELLARRRSNG